MFFGAILTLGVSDSWRGWDDPPGFPPGRSDHCLPTLMHFPKFVFTYSFYFLVRNLLWNSSHVTKRNSISKSAGSQFKLCQAPLKLRTRVPPPIASPLPSLLVNQQRLQLVTGCVDGQLRTTG